MADPRTMLRQPLMEDDCLQSEASVIAPLKSETSDVSALPRKGTMERVGSGNTRSRRGKTVLSRTSIYAGQSAAPLTTPSAEPTAPLAAASPLSPSSSADPTSPKGHASEQKWTKLRGAAKIRQMTAANASEQGAGLYESLDYELIESHIYRARGRPRNRTSTLVVTVLIASVIALIAFGIQQAVSHITRLRLNLVHDAIHSWAPHLDKSVQLAMGFGIFALVAQLCSSVACICCLIEPTASGSGVPGVMSYLNGISMRTLLSTRTLVTKVIGTIASVSSALPVGPEGPLVHIGTCVASFFTRQHIIKIGETKISTSGKLGLDMFHNDSDRLNFLSAGSAAGLAAAFGAPIGGVLFSLEEASSFWSAATTWRALMCTTTATFLLALLHGSGGQLSAPGLIQFGGVRGTYYIIELPLFALLAALLGLLGAVFNGCYEKTLPRRPTKWQFKLVEIMVVTLLCSAAFFFLPGLSECQEYKDDEQSRDDVWVQYTCDKAHYSDLATLFMADREDVLEQIMQINYTVSDTARNGTSANGLDGATFKVSSLLIAAAATYLFMVMAHGTAIPAGLFMPAMMFGSCLGGAYGLLLCEFCNTVIHRPDLANSIQPGSYALIGATAALAAIFHSAISLVVIVLEGIGNISFLLPIILSVSISRAVSDKLSSSFYDVHLEFKKTPFLHANMPESTGKMTVSQIMNGPVISFEITENVGMVIFVLSKYSHNGFPVTETGADGRSVLVGLIRRDQLFLLLQRRAFDIGDGGFGLLEKLPTSHPARRGSIHTDIKKKRADVHKPLHATQDVPDGDSLQQLEDENDGGWGPSSRTAQYQATAEPHVVANGLDEVDVDDQDSSSDEEGLAEDDFVKLDTDMRTFHHRQGMYNRHDSTGLKMLMRIGITDEEKSKSINLRPFMNISPLTIQADCSVQRCYRIFRSLGLRHLPVVDRYNTLTGMVTRKDFHKAHHHEPGRVHGHSVHVKSGEH